MLFYAFYLNSFISLMKFKSNQNMNDLIKITKNNKGTAVVSARGLYTYLGATERFQNWFERQLQYGFTENLDYAGCKVFNTLANQYLVDYAITVDMAKEVSMIQRTEKGKEARQYFIACQKELLNIKPRTHLEVIDSERALLIENMSLNSKLNQAKIKIEADRSKVIFAESVVGSKGSVLIRQFAKDLCTEDFKIGQKGVFDFLRKNNYINAKSEPYQQYVTMDIFEVITRTVGSGAETFATKTTKITGKGSVYLAEKIKSKHNE